MNDSTPKLIQLPLPIDGATVELSLSRRYVSIVDAIDADLGEFSWNTFIDKGKVYAFRYIKVGSNYHVRVWLHRVILERILGRQLTPEEVTDHKNSDGLDNRRTNLRVATQKQNTANRKLNKNNTSGYKGVSFNQNKRWVAKINSGKKSLNLGSFDTPELAYAAYCEAAKELHGEFARLE